MKFILIIFVSFFLSSTVLNAQENVALGKVATQSSNYGGLANKAVDGSTEGDYRKSTRSLTHTNNDNGAWWQVDLGAMYDITTIKLYNRTDCCARRLNNFTILVSKTEFTSNTGGTTFASNVPYIENPMRSFSGNSQGRYVRVFLNGKDYLSLAEVEVMGKRVTSTIPIVEVEVDEGAEDVEVAAPVTPTKVIKGHFLVSLTTADEKSASTDDNVMIRMVGYQGRATKWTRCDISGYNDFERGSTTMYAIPTENLLVENTEYPAVEVKLEGNDGLLLSRIRVVYDGESTLQVHNLAKKWLDGDDDAYRNTASFSLTRTRSKKLYIYPLTLQTTSAKSAGTDDKIEVRLSGSSRSTRLLNIDTPNYDDLESGSRHTYFLTSDVDVEAPTNIFFKMTGDDGWKFSSATFERNGYHYNTGLKDEWLDDDGSKTFPLQRLSLTNQIQVQLEKIVCVREDDGGGSAEELYGSIYAELNGYRQELWSRSEKNNMELTQGESYGFDRTVFYYATGTDQITLGGKLKEYDDGTVLNPNDNLGSKSITISVRDMLAAKKKVLRFTHEGTKIDVHFKVSKPSGKYIKLKSIKCIIPSKGTDGATAALVGVGIGVTTVGLSLGATVAGAPHTSAAILETGMSAAFASDEWVELYGKNHPGQDDLYLRMDGDRIWPHGRWKGIESQETLMIDQIYPFNSDIKLEVMEYDSSSDNDSMGKITLSTRNNTNETVRVLIEQEHEGSLYEITFEMIYY